MFHDTFTSRRFTRYTSSAPTMRTLLTASVYKPLEPPLQSVKMQFTSSVWNMNWGKTWKQENRSKQAWITIVAGYMQTIFCFIIARDSVYVTGKDTSLVYKFLLILKDEHKEAEWRQWFEHRIKTHRSLLQFLFSVPDALLGFRVSTFLNDSTPVRKRG